MNPRKQSMTDPTEPIRRARLAAINANPGNRAELKAKHGKVWDTQELAEEFEVLSKKKGSGVFFV
jgi:hypothetical protein